MADYRPAELFKIYNFIFKEKNILLNQSPQSINFDIDINKIIKGNDFFKSLLNIDLILKVFRKKKVKDHLGCIIRLTEEQNNIYKIMCNFDMYVSNYKNNNDVTFINLSNLIFLRRMYSYKPNLENRIFIEELKEYIPTEINFETKNKKISAVSINFHNNMNNLGFLINCSNRLSSTDYYCYVSIPTKYAPKIDYLYDEYWINTCCLF